MTPFDDLIFFFAKSGFIGALAVYCLVTLIYFLGATVNVLVNQPKLIANPVWVLGTLIMLLLSPVITPFMRGYNDSARSLETK